MRYWTALAGVLLVTASLPAQESSLDAFVRLETTVVDVLVDADFREYERARREALDGMRRFESLEARLDEALATLSESPTLVTVGEVERLEAEHAAAAEVAMAARARLETVRRRIVDQLRRSIALREAMRELSARGPTEDRAADPVSGLWAVTVMPSGLAGRFDLQLEGTLVTGTYRLDGGGRGSLRGTYVGERLKLERIDSEQGFDMIFEARVEPGTDRFAGSWRATLLSSSGPAGGAWSAARGDAARIR